MLELQSIPTSKKWFIFHLLEIGLSSDVLYGTFSGCEKLVLAADSRNSDVFSFADCV